MSSLIITEYLNASLLVWTSDVHNSCYTRCVKNELFHVMNRGDDKRTIVMDDKDRKRFVADLYAMNSSLPVGNMNYRFVKSMNIGRPYTDEIGARKLLVQIHAWCLMNNHYHLLLSEVQEDGISQYLKKLNMGYAKYFNERYKRSGALFQGKTKRVSIQSDAHYNWIAHYIHFNPLDYQAQCKQWRTQCLAKPAVALETLSKYRWSSWRDYIGEGDFPDIIKGSFIYEDRLSVAKESKRVLVAMSELPTELMLE